MSSALDELHTNIDNMLASAKAHLDAVSDGMSIDDSDFTLTSWKGTPIKGGQIIIRDGGAHAA